MGIVCAILVLQYPKSRGGIVDFCLRVVVGIGSGAAFDALLPLFLACDAL